MIVNIGSHREVFWDDYIIDTEQTTAVKKMHHPIRRECVMKFDELWEGDCCYFICMLHDNNKYRMYYKAGCSPTLRSTPPPELSKQKIRICYAESSDGINWHKPALGICEFNGSRDNNILLDAEIAQDTVGVICDNMYVFRDTNPSCPSDEVYKGICGFFCKGDNILKCFVSPDGIHFRFGWELYRNTRFFDSLNTAYYDSDAGKYYCFFRGWHSSQSQPDEIPCKDPTRDIRRMESTDFKSWTEPNQLDFGDDEPDFHLYTNTIQPYYRAPHIWVGFPFRYPERKVWTKNYDRLCGLQARRERMNIEKRFGYIATDCLFMTSRDTVHWNRPSEAFMRPGPENDWSWVYGDCFPNLGLIEVSSDIPGEAPQLSMLSVMRRWTSEDSGAWLFRYSLRVDGFISRHADYAPRTITTKLLVFNGNTLQINFETSAGGYVFIDILDKTGRPIEGFRTCELFGDSIDRTVDFDGNLAELNGIPVRLRFTFSDADLYSFRFIDT